MDCRVTGNHDADGRDVSILPIERRRNGMKCRINSINITLYLIPGELSLPASVFAVGVSLVRILPWSKKLLNLLRTPTPRLCCALLSLRVLIFHTAPAFGKRGANIE